MLPFFYQENLPDTPLIVLNESTSKHCIHVLRMQIGDSVMLTDGKGLNIKATIAAPDRKHCSVQVVARKTEQNLAPYFSLGISFTKNNSRNEWLLEKATEMGICNIYPLITQRSEREKIKPERLHNILVSAMLQSQQCFLPTLHETMTLTHFLKHEVDILSSSQLLIAHCLEEEKNTLLSSYEVGKNALVLIGPEGDFSNEEVDLCLQNGFKAVSLGQHRLRTETAGLYACTIFNAMNHA